MRLQLKNYKSGKYVAKLVDFSKVEFNANTVLTVGSFDGVHIGHAELITAVSQKAKELGGRSVIITFDPHPREIINPTNERIYYLSTLEERTNALGEYGIDELVVIPFNRDFSLLNSAAFIELIKKRIGISHYVIGYDHQFGKDRSGGIQTIIDSSTNLGFTYEIIEEKQVAQAHVSSSVLRKLLLNDGNVAQAKLFLNRAYSFTGTVIHGEKRGRTIGFPTANIQLLNPKKLIPKSGVYIVDVLINEQKNRAMMNIGVKPTFGAHNQISLEVHIFDFDQKIYGYTLRIEFLARIRDEQTFSSKGALIQQLNEDKSVALSYK